MRHAAPSVMAESATLNAQKCVEPGKAFTPDQGIRYHGNIELHR